MCGCFFFGVIKIYILRSELMLFFLVGYSLSISFVEGLIKELNLGVVLC